MGGRKALTFIYIRVQESEPVFLIHRDVFWRERGLHYRMGSCEYPRQTVG